MASCVAHVIHRPPPVTIARTISTPWDRVATQAIESGGSNTGEHGIHRCLLGPKTFDAFEGEYDVALELLR
jgi:hypothetical protein